MVVRAIVERILDPYTVKVRIPSIDRVESSSLHTPTDSLSESKICTLSNCRPNIQVGDVVIVYIDDNEIFILGYLYREHMTTTKCDMLIRQLDVEHSVRLPVDTNIGDVGADEIKHLIGVRENLQKQIDSLLAKLTLLEEKVNKITGETN